MCVCGYPLRQLSWGRLRLSTWSKLEKTTQVLVPQSTAHLSYGLNC